MTAHVLCASVFDFEVFECDADLFVGHADELVVADGAVGVVGRVSRRQESTDLAATRAAVDERTLARCRRRRRARDRVV